MRKTETELIPIFLHLESIRISGIVPAGPALTPLEAPDMSLENYITKHPTATIYLEVRGDSMHGMGIPHGSIIAVDTKEEPKPGDAGVFCLDDNQYTCKVYEPPLLVGWTPRGRWEIRMEEYRSVVAIGRIVAVIDRR